MRRLVEHERLRDTIEVDSAGTGAWHLGDPPDGRAAEAALARGIVLEGHARQVKRGDFDDFDLVIAMDRANMRELRELAGDEDQRAKIRLLREFDPASAGAQDLDVPDPYYGGPGGFGAVLDLVKAACEGLLAQIRTGEVP
jgi:protein-tyrosine phosphatase